MGRRPKQIFLQRHEDGQQAHEICSAPLIIREMQFKTTMRYHLTAVRMAIITISTNRSSRWLSGLRIQHYHCCGLGHLLWFRLDPWLGNFRMLQKQPKKKKSLQMINAGKGAEKKELSYKVGWILNWCSDYVEQYGVP